MTDVRTPVAVSVILPVYNAGEGLAAALVRITATCPENGEIIIVDDGSDDGSDEVARLHAQAQANVTLIALQRNAGVANARNVALRSARGEFVWFVDWDDDWDRGILDALLETARRSQADIAIVGGRWQTASGLLLQRVETEPQALEMSGSEGVAAMLQGRIKGYLWTKLIRRSIIPDPAFPPMRSQSDFCGLSVIVSRAARIVVLPDIMYRHVMRDGSITNSREPDLTNLTRCRDAIHAASSQIASPRIRRLQRLYDYEHWYLSRVHTALRLSSAQRARQEALEVRRLMKWGDIVRVTRDGPRTAVRAAAVKGIGPAYPAAWRGFVAVRRRARARRMPAPQGGPGD